MHRLLAVLMVLTCVAALALASAESVHAQPQPGQTPTEPGFEKFEGAPPSEQLPAQPLVMIAYGFIWVVLLVYGWSLWRRIDRVEREIGSLGQQIQRHAERTRR